MQTVYAFAETSPAAPSSGTASSQAVTGSSQGGGAGVLLFQGPALSTSLDICASLIGATGGTLDVYIQTSPNQGTTWVDYAHFPQLAAAAPAIKYRFTVSAYGQILVPAVVGFGLVPALPANTIVGGYWGDRMRLVFVAGASTTAGAAVSVLVSEGRPLPGMA